MLSERLTVSTETAKPTPLPSPLVVWIWALMPSTRPRASSSGPPEFPWLIAASVWIAPTVAKPVSDWIERSSAEMTPTDSDWSSPNGLPIAATADRAADRAHGRADGEIARRAERQRTQRQAGRVDAQERDVGERVEADDAGRHLVVVLEADEELLGLADVRALAARHDVRVRGDLAAAGDDEAGAEARLAAVAVRVPEARRDDRHDARRLALVDRGRVERARPALRVAAAALEHLDARRGRLRADGRRLVLASAAGGEQRRCGDGGDEATGGHLGSSKEKVVRPGTLSAESSPSMRSASSWAIASPRPETWAASEV